MKTAYINNLYPPYARGGAERIVEVRAQQHKNAGDEPVVITLCPWHGWGSWRPERNEEHGIVVYRFWAPNIASYISLDRHGFVFRIFWHSIDLYNLFSARIIARILRREGVQEVETHNLMGFGFFLPRMLRKNKIKHAHVVHDVQLIEPSGVLSWNHSKESFWQRLHVRAQRRMWGSPQQVIFPTQFLADFYTTRGFFPESEVSVEAPVRESFVSTQTQHTGTRTHFLFVGSLTPHKGLLVLKKAWSRLHARNADLTIVGGGPLFKMLKKWSKKRADVFVRGRLEGGALTFEYEHADVLIVPSVCIENRPTVIAEAKRYGLPVIASRTGGIPEMMSEKDVLVTPGDAGVLRHAIEAQISK